MLAASMAVGVLACAGMFFIGRGDLRFASTLFVLAAILWWFWLGWIVHLWSIIDAALYKPPA